MHPRNLEYSTKNIPIPSKQDYLKCLVEKSENLIKRMRWKAYFFDNNNDDSDNENNLRFGFKSNATPPSNQHLVEF